MCNHVLAMLIIVILLPFTGHTQDTGDCEISFPVDLTQAPDATWNSPTDFLPGTECCGMPEYYQCFELIVNLHEGARALEVEFKSAIGEMYYVVNCEGISQTVPHNRKVKVCVDDPTLPVSIVFCRPGEPFLNVSVTSLISGTDVEFPEFSPVCLNDAPLLLTQAVPSGGEYYINNESNTSDSFDPALYGTGEHTISYIYTNPETGCEGFAEQTILVQALPELTGIDLEFCQNDDPVILQDIQNQLPSGGTFMLGDLPISVFDPQSVTVGTHEIDYIYTSPETGCIAVFTFSAIVNPLPDAANLNTVLCDITGSGSVSSINLTDYELEINNDPEMIFNYFSDAGLSVPVPDPQNLTVFHNDIYYVEITNPATLCNSSSRMEFELHTLVTTDHTVEFCDESGNGSLQVYNFNPTDYNNNVYPTGPSITYQWFTDQNLENEISGLIPELTGPEITLFALVTDEHCSVSAELTITINEIPNIACPVADIHICQQAEAVDLYDYFDQLPAEGVFTQNGNPLNVFQPLNPGTFEIIYTYENPLTGCVATCPISIIVDPLPIVNDVAITLCDDANTGLLTNIDLTSYTSLISAQSDLTFQFFTDPGLSNAVANPAQVSVADGNTFYVLTTNSNGCSDIAEISFSLLYLDVTDTGLSLCDESGGALQVFDVNLANFNSQINGFLPGMSITWYSDSALNNPVSSIIPTLNNNAQYWAEIQLETCTKVVQVTFAISPLPAVNCPASIPDFCQSDSSFDLTGLGFTPAGGTFSGNGVNAAGIFNPATASAGNNIITYRITDPVTDCINTCSTNIFVFNAPTANNLELEFCDPAGTVDVNLNDYFPEINSDPTVNIEFFTDAALSNPVATPASFTANDETEIFALVTNTNTCTATASILFTVNSGIDLTPVTIETCDESDTGENKIFDIELSDYNNSFYPASPDVTYEWFTDAAYTLPAPALIAEVNDGETFYLRVTFDNCQENSKLTFSIAGYPAFDCNISVGPLCENDPPFDLQAAAPVAGGTFSGPGVTENKFTPSLTGIGTHTLSFSYDGGTGCVTYCEFDITVTPVTPVSCPDTLYFCTAGGLRILNQSTPAGGIYSGLGVSKDGPDYFFNPAITGIGYFPISYVLEDNNCTDTCEVIVAVLPLVDFNCDGDQEICVDASPLNLNNLCPEPGTFSGTGVSYNPGEDIYTFDPGTAGTGDFEITHIFTHPLSLIEYTCVFKITVNPLPALDCTNNEEEICMGNESLALSDIFSMLPAGDYYINNILSDSITPTTAGSISIDFVITDPITTCTNTCTIELLVRNKPDVSDITIDICNDTEQASVDLTSYSTMISSEPGISIAYYSDAGYNNLINNPSNYLVSNNDILFALVTDDLLCTNTASLTFNFSTIGLSDMEFQLCDQSVDSSQEAYNIDLSDYNADFYPSSPSVTYTWFSDALLTEEIENTVIPILSNGDDFYLSVAVDGCSTQAQASFTVLPLPEVTCIDLTVCDYADDLDLSEWVNPEEGVFSGDFVTGNIFDVEAAGPGIHLVDYQFTDANGCVGTCQVEVTVFYPEDFSCPDNFNVCQNEGFVLLDMATPAGGTYSGTGVSTVEGNFVFNPLVAGIGTHDIIYTLSDQGCSYSCSFEVTVTGIPELICPEDIIICEGDEDIVLSNLEYQPVGGTFSGPNVSLQAGQYIFETSEAENGTYKIEYTYQDSLTLCDHTCSFTIRVNPLPEIAWADDLSFCSNDETAELNIATPTGGIYSGDHITEGLYFNFGEAGAGTHAISYTLQTAAGCSTQKDTLIIIHEAPVALAGSDILLSGCSETALNGSATMGTPPYTWSWGPAALLNDPSLPNPQTFSLGGSETHFRLTVTDFNGCMDEDVSSVFVDNGLTVSLAGFDPLCINEKPFLLESGEPEGGTYYINNNQNPSTLFDPQVVGAGEHIVYYIVETADGCYASAETTITVNPLPQINWPGEEFCALSGLQPLDMALPNGGTFEGLFVESNQFNTDLAGVGTFPVDYIFTDTNGCTQTQTAPVTIQPLPNISAGPDQTILLGTYTTIEAINPDEGEFSYTWSPSVFLVNAQQQSTFTRELLYSQLFFLEVTNLETTCSAEDEMIILIEGGDLSFVFSYFEPEEICANDTLEFNILVSGGAPPYQYYWYLDDPQTNPSVVHINDDTSDREFAHNPQNASTYYLKVIDNDGNEIFKNFTPTVNPLPQITFAQPDPYCFDTEINIAELALPEGGNYFIDDGSGNPILLPYDPFPFVNTSDIGAGTTQLVYELTNEFGCYNSETRTIQIENIIADFTISQPDICQPNQIVIENHSQGSTDYLWSFDNNDHNTPENITDSSFTHIFPQQADTTSYTITLTVNHPWCPASSSQEIVIDPRPQPNFTIPEAGCSPLSIQPENLTIGSDVLLYNWDFGDGTSAVGENPEKTFSNYTTSDVAQTITLTVASNNFECFFSHEEDITIYPQLDAGFTIEETTGCSPFTVIVTELDTPADESLWNWGDGKTQTLNNLNKTQTLTHTYENTSNQPDTITIQRSVWLTRNGENVCQQTVEQTIIVFPAPEAVISNSAGPMEDAWIIEGCSPLTVQLSGDQSTNFQNLLWNTSDGNELTGENLSHTFFNNTNNPIDYTLTLSAQSENGCADQSEIIIRVLPKPNAAFIFTPTRACGSETINFTNLSEGLGELAYLWDFGNGEQSTNPDPESFFINGSQTQETFQIALTVTDPSGCVDSSAGTFTLLPEVTAIITTLPGATNNLVEGCAPLTVDLSAATSLNATQFSWDFGDGSARSYHQETTHTYDLPGTYTVTLSAGSQATCSDVSTLTVIVHPKPQVNMAVENNEGCSPLETSFDYQFTADESISYYWDFEGDGNFTPYNADALPETQLYSNTTTAPLTYPATFRAVSAPGCTSEFTFPVTVNPQTFTAINYTDGVANNPELVCSPAELSFSPVTTNNETQYFWDFGDGTTSDLVTPTHVFSNTTGDTTEIYKVVLTATSIYGCKVNDTVEIEVSPNPVAMFEIQQQKLCSGEELSFTNQSTKATSYFWDFGNGQTSNQPEPVQIFDIGDASDPQTFTITLTATNQNGCLDSFSREITIYPAQEAGFEASVLNGCLPLTVSFTNTSISFAETTAFLWDYGNGQTSETAETVHSHTFRYDEFQKDTVITVSLILYNEEACIDTFSVDIELKAPPMADFSAKIADACSSKKIVLSNLSTGAEEYEWDFGDGSDPVITNDDSFSYTYSPIQEAEATYQITLTAIGANGCISQKTKPVTVYPETFANFTPETNEGCHPLTTEFSINQNGIEDFEWDFGNGNTSNEENPVFTFVNPDQTEPVEHLVTLTAWNHQGCEIVITDTITVNPSPLAYFRFPEGISCAPFTATLLNESLEADRFLWNFGDGNTSIEEDPQHTWQNSGNDAVSFSVSLTAENSYGCESTWQETITVYPEIVADFTTAEGLNAGCSPLEISFINQSEGATSYAWDFGNNQSSQATNTSHTFYNNTDEPVDYVVQLVATSWFGCRNETEQTITVSPQVNAEFSVSPPQQSYPNTTIELINHFPDNEQWTYTWDLGDGTILENDNGSFTHTYQWNNEDLSTRDYTITLTVQNDWCSETYTQFVRITSPTPVAGFTGIMEGCAPYTVTLENNSTYAHSFRWNFGDETVSYDQHPQHTFFNEGSYQITLIAIGDAGRDSITQMITVLPSPIVDFEVESRLVYTPDDEIRLRNLTEKASFYLWEFSDGGSSVEFEPPYRFQQPGLYNISLTAYTDSDPQCSSQKTLENAVRVEEACSMIFPNAFTPDPAGPSGGSFTPGNSERKIFYPFLKGVEDYQLEIFNRWGELIFTSNDPLIGWDGYVNGQLVNMGVYVWKATARCNTGRIITKAGDVTLIR